MSAYFRAKTPNWAALAALTSSQSTACFWGCPVAPDLTGFDRPDRVGTAVEADDDDAAEAGRFQRRHGAERHGVVPGDHTLDVPVALDHRLHLLERLTLIPVGALPSNHLQVRILVEDVVIPAAADRCVRVRFSADQLDVVALLAHQPHELLRAERRALIVVRYDLRRSDAVGVDLAIDEDARNAGAFGLLDGGDRCVGAGVVQDDGRYFSRDGDVDQLILLVRIVIVRVDEHLVAEFLRLIGGSLGLRLEERVVVRRRDDRHPPGTSSRFRGRLGRGAARADGGDSQSKNPQGAVRKMKPHEDLFWN
jgi:hypothetical protein